MDGLDDTADAPYLVPPYRGAWRGPCEYCGRRFRSKNPGQRFCCYRHSGLAKRTAVLDRFWASIDKTDTCWLWRGEIGRNGYGRIFVGGRPRRRLVHRWAYEQLVGPIPPGLTIDHLCRVTLCVRPDHLEPVTAEVNITRGQGVGVINQSKVVCVRGHAFDETNTERWGPDGRWRRCRACDQRKAA